MWPLGWKKQNNDDQMIPLYWFLAAKDTLKLYSHIINTEDIARFFADILENKGCAL